MLLSDWSEEDVQTWLGEEGLQDLVGIFKTNNIDGAELSRMNKETVTELGIGEGGMQPQSRLLPSSSHSQALWDSVFF